MRTAINVVDIFKKIKLKSTLLNSISLNLLNLSKILKKKIEKWDA